MDIKCGIDMVLDSRIEKNMNDPIFMDRIYHLSEQKFGDVKKLTSIFALKEAVFKALDVPSSHWLDIEVEYLDSGKPTIVLSSQIKPNNLSGIDCSVTHENGTTQVIVVMLLQKEK